MAKKNPPSAKPPHARGGPPCSMGVALTALKGNNTAVYEAIQEWVEHPDPSFNDRYIHALMLKHGVSVAFRSIGHHRRHDCRCFH